MGGGGGGGVRTEAVATQKGVCGYGGVLEADTTNCFKGFSRVLLSFLPLSSRFLYIFFSPNFILFLLAACEITGGNATEWEYNE